MATAKTLWKSRALRPGDTDAPPPSTGRIKKAAPVQTFEPGSASAPHKTDLDKFSSKFGFGNTGMTGRS